MISAPPTRARPLIGRLKAEEQEPRPGNDREHAPDDPAALRLARRLREPALADDVFLERGIEVVDRGPELEQLFGLDVVARSRWLEPAQSELLGRAHRLAAVPRPLRLDHLVARRRVELHADLPTHAQEARFLAETDQAAARQVEHGRRQGAARCAAVHDHRARRRGEIGRWGRDVDRRRVEVDRVLAEAPPVEERPADEPCEDQRRSHQADHGIELAALFEPRRVLGRGRPRRCAPSPRGSPPSQSSARRCGSMSFSKIGLPLAVRQERGGEPGSRVELDLPAGAARLEVEEDRQAVIEALAADAPLVDQGERVASVSSVDLEVGDLRVDHDLGARALLDAIDRLPRPPRWSQARRRRRSRRRLGRSRVRGTAVRAGVGGRWSAAGERLAGTRRAGTPARERGHHAIRGDGVAA